jgi:drug/metabolite transporter (DMT)-like permease
MDPEDKERRGAWAGQGAVFLCAVFWSTSGLCIKLLDWHPMVIAGIRSLISALFMLGMRPFFRRRREKEAISLLSLLPGGAAYSATMIAFIIANKLTASANVILLQYSAPIWAALLGWALIRERPRREHWIALILVTGGLLLFFREGLAGGSLAGDVLAVFSGICFGANSVFLRMQKRGSPADAMILSQVITFFCCLPWIFRFPPVFTWGNTGAIFFMGIIQIGLASMLFAYGIKRTRAVQAMLTAMIEPILNPVWVFLVTGERPSPFALIGGGIIIGAVIFSSAAGSGRETGRKPDPAESGVSGAGGGSPTGTP